MNVILKYFALISIRLGFRHGFWQQTSNILHFFCNGGKIVVKYIKFIGWMRWGTKVLSDNEKIQHINQIEFTAISFGTVMLAQRNATFLFTYSKWMGMWIKICIRIQGDLFAIHSLLNKSGTFKYWPENSLFRHFYSLKWWFEVNLDLKFSK